MHMSEKQVATVLDLFCGAGGLSLGFIQAGFKVVCAIDNDRAALKTYETNLGPHVAEADLAQQMDLPQTTIIIGGPPCQGFSSAGLRRSNDHRNNLVNSFVQVITTLRPQAFVFENVEGFLTAENGNRVMELLTPLITAGYRIHLRKVNAANYGVPQHRKRVLAIGGLGWSPSFPLPTHSAFGAPGARRAATHLIPTPTVLGALADLPAPASQPPGQPQGHFYRPLQGVDLARASALKPGQTMRDLPEELQHASYRRRAFRRVMDGTPTERRGGAPAGIRRLREDEPAKAITSGAFAELLHPTENRPLTIRECARLQTFPDEFTFYGTATEQMRLIGNAVPLLLAQVVAANLAKDLANIPTLLDRGALLSFVPTLADGSSPALKNITERVFSAFVHRFETRRLPLWD
jgi:DNA (cytosine-5)-methyltransferase 1